MAPIFPEKGVMSLSCSRAPGSGSALSLAASPVIPLSARNATLWAVCPCFPELAHPVASVWPSVSCQPRRHVLVETLPISRPPLLPPLPTRPLRLRSEEPLCWLAG